MSKTRIVLHVNEWLKCRDVFMEGKEGEKKFTDGITAKSIGYDFVVQILDEETRELIFELLNEARIKYTTIW